MQSFANGLQKCGDVLSKELNHTNSFDTTTIAFSNIKIGLDKLVSSANQKAVMVMAEILEPFDHFQKSYANSTSDTLKAANTFWTDLEDHRSRLEMQQDRYYRLSSDAEQSDIEIESALLEHERGFMTIE